MKILLLVPDLRGTNGWSNYAAALGKELAAKGHTVAALTTRSADQPPFVEYPLLPPPQDTMANLLKIVSAGFRTRKIVQEFTPDIVHVIAEPYLALAPYSIIFARKKPLLFATVHGTYAYVPKLLNNPLKRAISYLHTRLAFLLCTEIIAVSSYTKKYLQRRIGTSSSVRVIYPGATLPDVSTIQSKLSAPHISSCPIRFLTVGALKARKGVVETIRGVAEFSRKTGIPTEYHVVGGFDVTSPYYTDVMRVAREEQYVDSLKLRGELRGKELAEEYRQADVYMHLALIEGNDFEGFGLGIIEGNSYGLPAIVRGAGGTTEAIESGKSGMLLSNADPTDVSAAIKAVVDGRDGARQARDWAEQFSIQKMAGLIEDRYMSAAAAMRT